MTKDFAGGERKAVIVNEYFNDAGSDWSYQIDQ
jgi:hypothetical protein